MIMTLGCLTNLYKQYKEKNPLVNVNAWKCSDAPEKCISGFAEM